MAETYIVIFLWITTLGLFVVYNKFHKHLNKTWERNMQYSLNGNDGKGLSLMRINGIGFSFYGKYREALVGDYKTYVTYHVFCLFFIPILPLGCCRVIKENGGYRILGGGKNGMERNLVHVSWFDKMAFCNLCYFTPIGSVLKISFQKYRPYCLLWLSYRCLMAFTRRMESWGI